MDSVNDDHATAAVFRALSDPMTLQLIIDALAAGQVEIDLRQRRGTAELAAASARLVDAGLVKRTREGDLDVYRVRDRVGVELLLAAARQLHPARVADR